MEKELKYMVTELKLMFTFGHGCHGVRSFTEIRKASHFPISSLVFDTWRSDWILISSNISPPRNPTFDNLSLLASLFIHFYHQGSILGLWNTQFLKSDKLLGLGRKMVRAGLIILLLYPLPRVSLCFALTTCREIKRIRGGPFWR